MKILITTAILFLLILNSCAKPETPAEQIERQYDPNNKNIQVIEIKQSHGLISDLLSGKFRK